ncbi:hypothetical protein FRC07_010048 [Ceratobasidium sp. 392]|nr:hypothetical protein FRC07_010048 [Ceratobasidium sp. 392]
MDGFGLGSLASQQDVTGPTFLSAKPNPFFSSAHTLPERSNTNKRKLTLLALINELTELREEEQESREREINYGPTADERLSSEIEGVERFKAFDEQVYKLDVKLQSSADAVRQLGSSVGLLNATHHLRARLNQVQHLFRENAAEQFEDVIRGQNPGTKPSKSRRGTNVRRNKNSLSLIRPPSGPWTNEIEDLPAQMDALSNDLREFLEQLTDMPCVVEESIKVSINAFENDLQVGLLYHASCLREFHGSLKLEAVAQYINDLSEDLGEHMERMRETLDIFITVIFISWYTCHPGFPRQCCDQPPESINCCDVLQQRHSYNHSVQTKGKKWLLEILEEQGRKAGAITGFPHAMEIVMSGAKRLRKFASRVKRSIARHAMGIARRTTLVAMSLIEVLQTLVRRSMLALSIATEDADRIEHRDEESQDAVTRTESPTSMFDTDIRSGNFGISSMPGKRRLSDVGKGVEDTIYEDQPLTTMNTLPSAVAASSLSAGGTPELPDSPTHNRETVVATTSRFGRFRATAQRVMNTLKVTQPVRPGEPIRSMSSQSIISAASLHRRDSSEHQLNPTHIQSLVPMLRTLRSSQMLHEHVALVKHLQFSSDGQCLATCSWDKTVLIWKVGSGTKDRFEVAHKLVHTPKMGDFVGQVAWSPTGDQLLTKQLKSIKVWDPKAGLYKRTIDRRGYVQSITWLPGGSGFVSVEWRTETNSPQADQKRADYTENIVGSDLVVLNTNASVKGQHYLERLKVWDAVVTPDEARTVAVVTLIRSTENLKPTKSRSEKRILTYFTKHPVEFAGPSYFGGTNDMFVLSASEGGEIYIWERASGILLHTLKALDQELTGITWNNGSPSGFMFASAAYDGRVRIWTTASQKLSARSPAPSPEPVEVDTPTPARQEFLRPSSPSMSGPSVPSITISSELPLTE